LYYFLDIVFGLSEFGLNVEKLGVFITRLKLKTSRIQSPVLFFPFSWLVDIYIGAPFHLFVSKKLLRLPQRFFVAHPIFF